MKPPNANTESISQTTPQTVIVLELHQIRCDGGTQGRAALNQSVIAEYAELMLAGAEFPPVRTWFDGESYWLADGFQRLAAAQSTGSSEIRAEVFYGSLEDARWDSYAANALHGLRRTRADIEVVVTQALRHPNGVRLSNREIARHLNLPETTLRRWRKTLICATWRRCELHGGTKRKNLLHLHHQNRKSSARTGEAIEIMESAASGSTQYEGTCVSRCTGVTDTNRTVGERAKLSDCVP